MPDNGDVHTNGNGPELRVFPDSKSNGSRVATADDGNEDVTALTPLQEQNGDETTETQIEQFVPPDGGWGWVVAVASFWVNGTVFGMLNTFGILLPEMINVFGADGKSNINFKVSLVASISLFTTFFMSMISSIAADQLGIRKVGVAGGLLAFTGILCASFVNNLALMYVTFGIMFGVGSSFLYSGSLVILGHYFSKWMGVVNGFVTLGSSIFTIGLPYLQTYLLKEKGLSFTLQMQAALFSTTIICALAFKPLLVHPKKVQSKTSKKSSKPRSRSFLSTESVSQVANTATRRMTSCATFVKRYLNTDIWKIRGYVIWSIAITLSLFGYFIPLVHLNNYVKVKFPESSGNILIMVIGGVSGVARVLSGVLSDISCVSRIRFQQVAFVLYGISSIVIPFVNNFIGLTVLCVVLGFMDGCFICLLGPIAFELVGAHNASQAMGFLLALISIPLMLGPMIGGWIYDLTASYDYAFYFAGIPPLIGSVVLFFIPRAVREEEEQPPSGQTHAAAFASISHWSLYEPRNVINKPRGNSLLVVGAHGPVTFNDDQERVNPSKSRPSLHPALYYHSQQINRTTSSQFSSHPVIAPIRE